MGKMMPLKWIEQAEARQVWVIATSERIPMPGAPMAATSFRSSLVRLRSWIAPADEDREDGEEWGWSGHGLPFERGSRELPA